jgi:hypothetical protein
MTIDLIDVFCRQSIIGINPIDVFLTIGAHLWQGALYLIFLIEKLKPLARTGARLFWHSIERFFNITSGENLTIFRKH